MLPALGFADGVQHRLQRGADAVGVGQAARDGMLQSEHALRAHLHGDVFGDAAVAAKHAVVVEHRVAADVDFAQPAGRIRSLVDEVAKRQMRFERRAMLAPLRLGHAADRQLPARLAVVGSRTQRGVFGGAAAARNEAEVLVLLPVPVGRQLGQAAKARLALAQRRQRVGQLEIHVVGPSACGQARLARQD